MPTDPSLWQLSKLWKVDSSPCIHLSSVPRYHCSFLLNATQLIIYWIKASFCPPLLPTCRQSERAAQSKITHHTPEALLAWQRADRALKWQTMVLHKSTTTPICKHKNRQSCNVPTISFSLYQACCFALFLLRLLFYTPSLLISRYLLQLLSSF